MRISNSIMRVAYRASNYSIGEIIRRYNNPADRDIQPCNDVLRVCEEVDP